MTVVRKVISNFSRYMNASWSLIAACAVCCVTVVGILGMPLVQESIVLDFSDFALPRPNPLGPYTVERGFTSVGGNIVEVSGPSSYALPLQLEVLSITSDPTQPLEVEVLFRNIGDQPFDLPISVDGRREAILPGQLDRRMFSCMIELLPPDERSRKLIGVQTVGSATYVDSLFRLEASDEVRIRFRVDTRRPLAELRERGVDEVDVRVICDEHTLEDSRYAAEAISDELASSEVFQMSTEFR